MLIEKLFGLVDEVVDLYHGSSNLFESSLSKRHCRSMYGVEGVGKVVRHAGRFLGAVRFWDVYVCTQIRNEISEVGVVFFKSFDGFSM